MTHRNTVGRNSARSFRQRCSILLIPLVLLLGVTALAQTPTDPQQTMMPDKDTLYRHLRIGAAISGQLLHYSTPSFFSLCSLFPEADASAFTGLAFYETEIHSSPSLWFSSQLRILNLSARFADTVRPLPLSYLENGERVDITGQRQQFFTTSVTGISISPGIKWEPWVGANLGVDASLIVLVGGKSEQTEEILDPPSASYIDGTDSRVVESNLLQFSSVAVDVGFSLGYMLPLNRLLSLYMMVRPSWLVTSLAQSVDMKGNSITGSIGIAFGGAPQPKVDSLMPPVIVQPVPPQPEPRPYLSVSVRALGIDDNGKTYENPVIEIEEAPWTESSPMIPYVFFGPGSADIPARYAQLNDPENVDTFSLDSLTRITPLDIHWNVLNIIGMRLRQHPDVTMTISGRTSGEERGAAALAAARARSVRDYLLTAWNIDPDRIIISNENSGVAASEITEDGREENRRAEFRFSDESLIRPVVIERIARVASPPSIRFYPEFVTDTDIARWIITIFQGNKELVRFEGSSDKESLQQSRMWMLGDNRVNRDFNQIGYRLDAWDTTGQMASAEGTFNVTERVTRSDDSLIRRNRVLEFDIVGFNYDSPILLDRQYRDLQDVAAIEMEHAQVQITGYTDRVGDVERNRQLALERAQGVRQTLVDLLHTAHRAVPSDLTVQGYGGEVEPFDNDLPEGRILSRMVKITISSYRPEP